MPAWLMATLLATLLFGIYPIFGDRAVRVHGPKTNLVLYAVMYMLLGMVFLIINRQEVLLITKKSLINALLMGVTSISAVIFMMYAWQLAPPNKLPIIMVTLGFSAVITAIISNFIGERLTLAQFFWIFGATVCITGLNWKR
ncbi:MAG: EamA family transporter [Patescibacteria group bacterium]